jgi:hypothetical protein
MPRPAKSDGLGEAAGREGAGRIVVEADAKFAVVALDDQTKQLRVLLFRRKPLIELCAVIAGFVAKSL